MARPALKIFTSYRRADSMAMAQRIHAEFEQEYGQDQVFLDADLGAGDWLAQIFAAINQADACVIVIGPDWLTMTNAAGNQRLFELDDIVRREVELALFRPLVVTVLVNGASVPPDELLPKSIRLLPTKQAFIVRADANGFADDMRRVTRAIDQFFDRASSPARPRPVRWLPWSLVALMLVALVVVALLTQPWRSPAAELTAAATEASDVQLPARQVAAGIPMVSAPVGCFVLGNDPAAYYADNLGLEVPTGVPDGGRICFDQPFWIDQTEVTQADYARLGGGATETSPFFVGDRLPMEQVTWIEAAAFCALRGGRLPTEAEWEYAARGPENPVFPWGDDWDADRLVWAGNSDGQTGEVGQYLDGGSWIGALDMVGNVWEWTLSVPSPYPYEANADPDLAMAAAPDGLRVVRGGSMDYEDVGFFRAATRDMNLVTNSYNDLGFRCLIEVPSAGV